MADPFEVRMRFTSQLQHLNASVTSSQKAAHYALKYKDMDEDLHSCILEQLERNSMNTRANIMYFIEHLCDMAQKESHLEYIRMIQRDILRVVDAVAPEDGSGAANVKVIRRVLNGLQSKSILDPQTVSDIEACLKERDTLPSSAVLSPIPSNIDNGARVSTIAAAGATAEVNKKSYSTNGTPRSGGGGGNGHGSNDMGVNGGAPRINGTGGGPTSAAVRLDKKQIEQRIEEDRERHKRLRESIWAVNPEEDAEFEKLWEEASELGDDDYLIAKEEMLERKAAAAGVVVDEGISE